MTKKISDKVKQSIISRIKDGVATSISESKRTGIPPSTIRGWIQAAKKGDHQKKIAIVKEAQEILDAAKEISSSPVPTHYCPTPTEAIKEADIDDTPITATEQPNIIEQIRMSAFDGYACSAEGIRHLRENVPGAIDHVSQTLIAQIAETRLKLEAGKTYKHAVYQGDITEAEVHMTIQDRSTLIRDLASLTQQLVDLAIIPYGAIAPTKFIEPKEPINQQHLHLHAHGSTAHKPLERKITPDKNTPSTAPAVIIEHTASLSDWQKDLLGV